MVAMSYSYSLFEELKGFPERIVSSSASKQRIIDWKVAWKARQSQVSSSELLSPFPQQVTELLRDLHLHSLKVQVFNTPVSELDEGHLLSWEDDTASSAGLSVTAIFSVPLEITFSKTSIERILDQRFRQVLLDIFTKRFTLGSLESVYNPRLHRFAYVDWQNMVTLNDSSTTQQMARIPVVLWLPHEAFSLSAEGMSAFLQNFHPCPDLGIMGLHSPTEWSNLLLGQEELTSSHRMALMANDVNTLTSWGRRGLWLHITHHADDNDNNNNQTAGKNSKHVGAYQMEMGLVWKIRTNGDDSSWANLLGSTTDSTGYKACPFADSTDIRLLKNPYVPVYDKCEQFSLETNMQLKEKCLQIPTDSMPKSTASPDTALFSVQANLQRTSGPGHGGRIQTIVQNRHASCDAQVQIWQVIPPVLEPIWSSFSVSENIARPQRRWKNDGSLELTLVTNMTSNSALRYAFDYQPAFLSFEKFPADPNRGFEIPPVRVIVEPRCQRDVDQKMLPSKFNLFSESLLFLSPLPDASMPFNVLSLSCTLLAFVIGSILNLLVRRASERIKYKLHPELKPKGKLKQIKERVGAKFKMLGRKLLGSKEMPEQTNEKEKGD